MTDPKLLFWTWALLNMAAVLACAVAGVRAARHHQVGRHKRWMLASSSLVVLFLLAYVGKSWLLGAENLASWNPTALTTLRAHETAVSLMLLAGGFAGWLAWRLPRPRLRFPSERGRRRHQRAGWIALISCALGFCLAVGLLAQMFAAR